MMCCKSSGTRSRLMRRETVKYGTPDGWETDGRPQRTYLPTFQVTRMRRINHTGKNIQTFSSIASIHRVSMWSGKGPTRPILRADRVRQIAPHQCSRNLETEEALGPTTRNWFSRTENLSPDPQSLRTLTVCCTWHGMQPTRWLKGMLRSDTSIPQTTGRHGRRRHNPFLRLMGSTNGTRA